MGTVVDMRRRKVETLDEMVNEINRQFGIALDADHNAYRARIEAGDPVAPANMSKRVPVLPSSLPPPGGN
jgi:hypothetical protein